MTGVGREIPEQIRDLSFHQLEPFPSGTEAVSMLRLLYSLIARWSLIPIMTIRLPFTRRLTPSSPLRVRMFLVLFCPAN